MSTSSSSSTSLSDAESDSSTVVYDHEPFNTFHSRVLNFALHKIWPDAAPDEISVERMAGGGYNRVIGISRQPAEHPGIQIRYIIRIPRFSDARVDTQAATLRLVNQYSKIPVPTVVCFDQADDNELGSRYMVQHRVPGTSLLSSYPRLAHNERCRIARELGRAYRELLSTRSDAPGFLTIPADSTAPCQFLPWQYTELAWARELNDLLTPPDIHQMEMDMLLPWQRLNPAPTEEYSHAFSSRPIDEMLIDIFMAQKATELRHRQKSLTRLHIMDRFCNMASELAAGGWFANCHLSLAHLDLAPRNILANPTYDAEEPIISAVLDWDSAVIAPQFMCSTPPVWIWTWLNDDDNDDDDDDDEYDDERMANQEPPTPEGRQLKQLFEEAAGPDYARFAYTPAYQLARRLVRFSMEGLYSNESIEEAEALLAEWELPVMSNWV
ncbi:hypothetical protein F4820DRAFT_393044 [Hypoxylon rubiginosum]|uniref:Uncharacterized protein n=1 Tax=Hypoxylon rubiginosum TaxID=110542 RepID=A0ACB9YUJ4_9PEZI|nr:hypothetical protein F4820DRAFT_393044 [Hypoxylon rubiginosum]